MAAIIALAPLIAEGLAAYRETIAYESKKLERELILLEKITDDALLAKYIEQIIENEAIDLENKAWWQRRFKALGDVFDGDAWARIRELFADVGLELPGTPPAPPPTA